MILLDSSVWVDYLRGRQSRATVEVRRRLAEQFEQVAMCEPVAMELLAGAPDESALVKLGQLVDGLPSLILDETLDFRTAAHIHRSARRAGLTLRGLNDCLIAAIAIRHQATIIHQDVDFEVIGSIIRLEHVSLR